jgi:hypothetical protein
MYNIILIALVIVIGVPIWVLTRIRRLSRLQDAVARLEARIDTLSETVVDLRRELARNIVDPSTAASTTAPGALGALRTSPSASTSASTPDVHVGEPPPAPRPSVTMVDADTAATESRLRRDASPTATTEAGRIRATPSTADLEERLGTNWLNKLGALLLVVGVALFLMLQLRTLGPAGKDAIGLVVAAVLLVGGIVAERRSAYRVFSRGMMAGAWGLLFFTVWAMQHIDAARVISSEPIDLVLMFAVAAGMVGHALRYRSQVVTGLAFLFAFATVALGHDTAFTLTAGAVLAIASAATAVRMRWFVLELGAIAGTYLNHFLWMPVLAATPSDRLHARFDESLILLLVYWLTFRGSYIVRRNLSDDEERWSSVGAVANTAGLLLVVNRQPLDATVIFWSLLALGAADAVAAWFIGRRRLAFSTLVTLAVVLVGAAFPLRLAEMPVAFAWLLEAEALIVIGILARDVLFTRLGLVASVIAGFWIAVRNVLPLFDSRIAPGPHASAPFVAALLAIAAVVYYVNGQYVRVRWPQAFAFDRERSLANGLPYAGAAALVGAAWALVPGVWLAVLWAALALVLIEAARHWDQTDVLTQAQGLAACATLRIVGVNLSDTGHVGPVPTRLLTVALVAAAHHATRCMSDVPRPARSATAGTVHSWVGSALVATLIWYQLEPLPVALAWTMAGVVALELGVRFARRDLRQQAFATFAIAFARIFYVNLNAGAGLFGPAMVATAPMALLFFYVYDRIARLDAARESASMPALVAAFGSITLAATLRTALTPSLVVVSWAAVVLILAFVARVTGRTLLLRQATAGAVAVGVQGVVVVNLYGASYFADDWSTAWAPVGAAAVLLLAALPLARQARQTTAGGRSSDRMVAALQFLFVEKPDQLFYFVPLVLVAWLLAVRATGGFVTMTWGIEAVAAFMLALWLHERSFRLGALALLLGCVVRIALIDVWQMDQQGRYVAFMGLGVALLLVSFLYSKYREQLKEFL